MKILAIESSCDDTSVALVEVKQGQFKILAEKTASQIEIHKKYGGVVPEIAGRMHAEKIMPLIEAVLRPPLNLPLIKGEKPTTQTFVLSALGNNNPSKGQRPRSGHDNSAPRGQDLVERVMVTRLTPGSSVKEGEPW